MKFYKRLVASITAFTLCIGGSVISTAADNPWDMLPAVTNPWAAAPLADTATVGLSNGIVTFDVTMENDELVVTLTPHDVDQGLYMVYKMSTNGSWLRYTNPIAVIPGVKTQIWAGFTSNGTTLATEQYTYEIEADMNGSFPVTETADDIKTTVKGRYMTIDGPGSGVRYDISIYNATTGNLLQSYVDKTGPFSGESYVFPATVDSYYIEYFIYKSGKMIARRVGESTSIDKTYMPEPYNLAFDTKTYKATASTSPPANMVEYELINTATNMSAGKNTTGSFPNVASGTYELHATAYSSDAPTVRSQVAKLSPIIVDRDKPIITFVPVALTGATAGVIVNAKDDGSGIDRIEVVVNEGTPQTINSGATVYATKDGTNTITAYAYDRAGNSASETTTVKFDASGLSPKITIKAVTEKQQANNGTTKNPAKGEEQEYYKTNVEATVSATNLTAMLEYLILNDGEDTLAMKQFNPAVTNATMSVELSEDGEYLLRAQALSPGGVISGGVTERTVKIDQTSPDKPVITLKNGNITITAEDNFSGIDKIEYQIDDGDRQVYSGPTKIRGEGEVEVKAVAYDKAGNFSELVSATFVIDNEPPDSPTISGVPDGWWKSEDAVVITIEPGEDGNPDADNEVVTYYRVGAYSSASDGADSKKTGWSKYKSGEELVFDEEGRFTVSAYCVDSEGNESDVTSADIKIDYTNPSMRATSTNFKTQNTRANFKLYFGDEESGIDKIYCMVDGKEAQISLSGKSKKNGYVNLTLDMPKVDPSQSVVQAATGTAVNTQTLDPSQHVVSFRALDYAGNESTIELQSKLQETFYDSDGTTLVGNSADKGNPYTGR